MSPPRDPAAAAANSILVSSLMRFLPSFSSSSNLEFEFEAEIAAAVEQCADDGLLKLTDDFEDEARVAIAEGRNEDSAVDLAAELAEAEVNPIVVFLGRRPAQFEKKAEGFDEIDVNLLLPCGAIDDALRPWRTAGRNPSSP